MLIFCGNEALAATQSASVALTNFDQICFRLTISLDLFKFNGNRSSGGEASFSLRLPLGGERLDRSLKHPARRQPAR